jgi:hypothetical protein
MSRLPALLRYKRRQDRWKRFEKPQPGHRVQVDMKFVASISGTKRKHYQFTAIEDCMRFVLRIYDHLNHKAAVQFIAYMLEKLPSWVQVIQTDSGVELRPPFAGASSAAASSTCTSGRPRPGSTARSNDHMGSMLKSSTAPRWLSARRCPPLPRQVPGMGRQFRPPARRLGGPSSLRAPAPKDRTPRVSGHRQLHSQAKLITRRASASHRRRRHFRRRNSPSGWGGCHSGHPSSHSRRSPRPPSPGWY